MGTICVTLKVKCYRGDDGRTCCEVNFLLPIQRPDFKYGRTNRCIDKCVKRPTCATCFRVVCIGWTSEK